jgi:FkbM family methyltransferase
MKINREKQGLIMDIGVSDGNDTAFYLAKGFQVIAVEADPTAYTAARHRFASEISCGDVMLLNLAASRTFGDFLEFHAHSVAQGISSVRKRPEVDPARYKTHSVMTVDWLTLRSQAGVPRYLKIDIEGGEAEFLAGMLIDDTFPEFVSIEAYAFPPCEALFQMGYRRFKLIDQKGNFQLPATQFEGVSVDSPNFAHTSGPFGLDLFAEGEWMDFLRFKDTWHACAPRFGVTWFDCHAWKPN